MSRKPLKIGITGGIGSGKTTVCKIFQFLGIPVYNADERAKWLMQHDDSLKTALAAEFGSAIFNDGGSLDRKALASIVFNNQEQLEKLNAIVHPAVGKDFDQWAESYPDSPYVLKEAALLIESGSYKKLFRTIMVHAPEEVRMQRVLARDSFRTEDDVKKIMESQMPEKEKTSKCDHVIYNDGVNMVTPQVIKLHELFILIYENQPADKQQ
ncbi:dephospho-CoA kinase [Cytophagaceae bacterium ABcell3]|nr:dephospho-CoA kinase [Cytophagaceae bacterium ABcell3]